MEDGLRVDGDKYYFRESELVLILVLMEDGLRENLLQS